MKGSRRDRHLPWQRGVLVVMAAAVLVAAWGAHRSPMAAALAEGRPVSLLLFGTDTAEASLHTDTLMVAVFDPLRNSASLLSIPRDTRMRLPGYLFRRVNEIYGYHLRRSDDPDLASEEVRKGVEHLLFTDAHGGRIPYHLHIDYNAFRRLVDLVGGVWVTIRYPMHYDDFAGGYHFHREPGRYLMSGAEALLFVRYRGATGDRGRILRQQEFLRALARRAARPSALITFPRWIGVVATHVHTNLSVADVVFLAVSARRLRAGDIRFFVLPGRPRGSFWFPQEDAVGRLAGRLLGADAARGTPIETIVPQTDVVTVNVWNASAQRGLAHDVTRFLRARGFDVVEWGNYPARQIPTRIIDRTGDIEKAIAVARSLGVYTFHSEPQARSFVDVEVVLGKNYNGAVSADPREFFDAGMGE